MVIDLSSKVQYEVVVSSMQEIKDVLYLSKKRKITASDLLQIEIIDARTINVALFCHENNMGSPLTERWLYDRLYVEATFLRGHQFFYGPEEEHGTEAS